MRSADSRYIGLPAAYASTRHFSPAMHAITTPSMAVKSLLTKSWPGAGMNMPRRQPASVSSTSPNSSSSSSSDRKRSAAIAHSAASPDHSSAALGPRSWNAPHQWHVMVCEPW